MGLLNIYKFIKLVLGSPFKVYIELLTGTYLINVLHFVGLAGGLRRNKNLSKF